MIPSGGLLQAEFFSKTGTVIWMHLGKQCDLAALDRLRHLRQLSGDSGEHALMFFGTQQIKQCARLAVVVVVLAMIPVFSRTFDTQRRFAEVRLILEQTEAVRLLGYPVAAVTVHAHRAITPSR